eukprot:TRINITY_DN66188_c0_g1_i1.p1 TRINITY_DN66188_c0_g1~~TRINITY_DN66188_c0_g1_i1.p1  ORF type:complete len:286 (+),score=55.13 TRINITY_DN66188_c0_g1_i1:45-860(+)
MGNANSSVLNPTAILCTVAAIGLAFAFWGRFRASSSSPCSEKNQGEQEMNTSDAKDGGIDLGNLQGIPRGGALGPGRFLFRGQVFWQQLLPEQVATSQLEFQIGIGDDSRNFARIPHERKGVPEELPADHPQLIAAAVCYPSGREDEGEVAKVMRSAADWGDHIKLRRLLASCFVSKTACKGALCSAALGGHEAAVSELLRAKACPGSDDGAAAKTALHFACEQGHEGVARLLLEAKADLNTVDATGRTPCELAREQDLGMMAKRLEKLAS